MRLVRWLLAVGSWVLVQAAPDPARRQAEGSCRAAGLCCPGRDASCVVQKAVLNTIVEDPDEGACYCDHACLRLGDCCHDFKESCGVVDCQMSEWGPWSECDASCGPGVMSRDRTVLGQPRNGGLPCTELLQRRGCYGMRCESMPDDTLHRETAMLLPVTFSQLRYMNDSYDIRQNLKYLPKSELSKENNATKPYVVLFEVTKTRKACETLEAFSVLKSSQHLCVSCESTAMRKHLGHRCTGHGIEGMNTRFAALGHLHCHGRWQRVDTLQHCPHGRQPDFIFV
ncbi:somatomedin-B and thrombospondin type-1 domain-containing protein [Ixodes scapularis]|uniref:RPE-spondin, putative n=1 Tax=Ixodes scapularis TaxID=6945 RepID=B7PBG4_IXOSC|nr:somatomedin-B and thrombospondin type-1 domain-containing protein [Ixodes scapularis]EEC03936.1 RPE-spondin, putative [Ixodes scapularis]|eukprot:XP_002408125.1 RPE-spondin, putative [Ixodes scapularis]